MKARISLAGHRPGGMPIPRKFGRLLICTFYALFVAIVTIFGLSSLDIFGSSGRHGASSSGVQLAADHQAFPGYKIAPDTDTGQPSDVIGKRKREKRVEEENFDSKEKDLGSRNSRKKDWSDDVFYAKDQERTGPGEQGAGVSLPRDNLTMTEEDVLYRANGYNAMASDKISVNRSVRDSRISACKSKRYLTKLPRTSVIMPFHDEHWSVLLRSCWSIINRTPKELLHEIVIVDDNSTKEFLQEQLEQELLKNLPLVKLVRTTTREGLIRARQIGARAATGEVLVFLDIHSEANYNWLPPLIEPIALNYRTVTCPYIDVINCDSFAYNSVSHGSRGSFDWEFHYKQFPLRPGDQNDPSDNYDSPVMAGGYFAVSSRWFWELGGYDEGLDIWGGEQYELSFKVWQCHGKVLDVPCSHVGHIYRCKYQPFPNPNVGDFISRNYRRVAEVWMDEWKEYLYKNMPLLPKTDPGDLTKQKAVREKLKCKPFKYFMEEVMPDQDQYFPAKLPPDGASGNIKSVAYPDLCIDANSMQNEALILYQCNANPPQVFRATWFRDIRVDWRGSCFIPAYPAGQPVKLTPCTGMGGNQWWTYDPDTQMLSAGQWPDGICLDVEADSKKVIMNKCDKLSNSQKWEFTHVNRTILADWKVHPRKTY